jgi:hypothetical protein
MQIQYPLSFHFTQLIQALIFHPISHGAWYMTSRVSQKIIAGHIQYLMLLVC